MYKQRRNNDDDNNRNFNNSTNDYTNNEKCELRLLIDANWAVVITANTKEKLGAKYNAVFHVLDRATPDCVLTIRCPLATIEHCVADVLSKFNSFKTIEQKNRPDVRVLIQRTHARALVKHNGRKLEQLRKNSKCSFTVAAEPCPGSTEHVCRILGAFARFPRAVKHLVDFMQHTPVRGSQLDYDPKNYSRDEAYDGFDCTNSMTPLVATMLFPASVQQVQAVHRNQPVPLAAVRPFQPLPSVRNSQSAENGEDDNNNKLLAEQLQKVRLERDVLVVQSLERKAKMLAQSEELKQAKEDLDWMMTNLDELITVELKKRLKSQMAGDGTAKGEKGEEEVSKLRALELALKEALRAKKSERAKRKALEEKVEKLNRKLEQQDNNKKRKMALTKRTSDDNNNDIDGSSSKKQRRCSPINILDMDRTHG